MTALTAGPPKQNPFQFNDKWYWFDEAGEWSKPHGSQREALTSLLKYMKYLEDGPTLGQRVRWEWWPKVKEFWRDTRGTR